MVRWLFTFAICWFACLSSSGSGRVNGGEPNKPNILFLICDDLNCDIGCYGHPQVQTPNIDALARRGVRFESAHCQFPLCGPSRASLMTGLYPSQTRVQRNAIYLREHLPDVLTMPQHFRASGYFATRIGKIFHYHVPKHIGTSGHDDPWSWDYTINPRGRDVDDEEKIFSLVPGSFGGTLSWLAAEGEDQEQTDGIAADEAIQIIRQHESGEGKQPFFLAVGLYRPHTPYVAPKKYFDLYPLDSINVPEVPAGYFNSIPELARRKVQAKKHQNDLSEALARQAIQAYYASITFADAQVGRILDALDSNGLADNTIVVFSSDHGYHMGEHGHWQKMTLFENATRVPLIFAGPGVTEHGKSSSQAELVDVYPTVSELAGFAAPRFLAGVSLKGTLADTDRQARQDSLTMMVDGYTLRDDHFRLTWWGENGSKGKEFYSHQDDTEELTNLIDSPRYQERIESMSLRLAQRIVDANRLPKGVKQIQFENRRKVPVRN